MEKPRLFPPCTFGASLPSCCESPTGFSSKACPRAQNAQINIVASTFWPSEHQAICQKMNVLGCGKEPTLFHGPGHMQKIKMNTYRSHCLVTHLSILKLKIPWNGLANTKIQDRVELSQ